MAAIRSSSGLFLLFIYLCQCVYSVQSELWTEEDSRKLKLLRRDTKVSKSPCSCDGKSRVCTCCAKFAIDDKIGDEGCASFVVPDGKSRNQLVRYSFNFIDQSISSMMPAGVDPPALCVSLPIFFGVNVCGIFYDVFFDLLNFNICIRVKVSFGMIPVFEARIDCIVIDEKLRIKPKNKSGLIDLPEFSKSVARNY